MLLGFTLQAKPTVGSFVSLAVNVSMGHLDGFIMPSSMHKQRELHDCESSDSLRSMLCYAVNVVF